MKYQWVYKEQPRTHNILLPLLFMLYMNLVIKELHGINDYDKQCILA